MSCTAISRTPGPNFEGDRVGCAKRNVPYSRRAIRQGPRFNGEWMFTSIGGYSRRVFRRWRDDGNEDGGAIVPIRENFNREVEATNRATAEAGLSARSSYSFVVALLLAAVAVLFANEPIIAMYSEQFVTWCRRRF